MPNFFSFLNLLKQKKALSLRYAEDNSTLETIAHFIV